MRFYCTSTGPIGGLNCEILLMYVRTYVRMCGGRVVLVLKVKPFVCYCMHY